MIIDTTTMGLYKRKSDIKVIRTQHEITIKMNYYAKNFKEAFSRIPDDAKLIDIDVDKDNNDILIFEVEQEDVSTNEIK